MTIALSTGPIASFAMRSPSIVTVVAVVMCSPSKTRAPWMVVTALSTGSPLVPSVVTSVVSRPHRSSFVRRISAGPVPTRRHRYSPACVRPAFAVRFDLRNPAFAGVSGTDRYQAALDMAEWADANGSLMVVLSEHHGCDDGYLPSA